MADIDLELANQVAELSWVADGVTGEEWVPVAVIRDIAKLDVELAKTISLQSWLADGVTVLELNVLNTLALIGKSDRELAKRVLDEPFMAYPLRQRAAWALEGLYELLVYRGRNVFETVANQPWFEDGLDYLDAVLLAVMRHTNDDLLHALSRTHYIASRPIDLPLAGNTELVVIRHTPFPNDDETLAAMEEGVRSIESFTRTPIEMDDIVLLINEPRIWQRASGSAVGSSEPGIVDRQIIVHNRDATGWPVERYKDFIYHELGHLYTLHGPRWLVEGTAEFLRAYVRDQTNTESIDERLTYLHSYKESPSELPDAGCDKKNLHQHLADWAPNNCDYYLGEAFLLGMYKAIGAEGVSAALEDLRIHGLRYNLSPGDDLIYQAFERNTPAGRQETFHAAYQRHYGGQITELPPAVANRRSLLAELYKSAHGATWVDESNWLSEKPLGEWYGVITDISGRVTGLALSGNGLTGEIPPAIGNLVNLGQLDLGNNNFDGSIPVGLGDLVNLKELDFGGSALSGKIPHDLALLTNLHTLNLGDNQLSGEIPPELALLHNIEELYIYNNQLSGEIPAEFGSFPNLLRLQLRGNRLTGEIPTELGRISTLRRLELSDNLLSGQIPTELTQLTDMGRLTMARNNLSGYIPPELANLSALGILDLSENQFVGGIPPEFGDLTKLRGLALRGNQLSGKIPMQLGNLFNISTFDLSENELTGNIPQWLSNFNKLWTLDLSDNQLDGEIPPELGSFKHLISLDISNNQLVGKIPLQLEDLPNVKELFLSGNKFTGCIPAGLRNVKTNDFEQLSIPFCDVEQAGNSN